MLNFLKRNNVLDLKLAEEHLTGLAPLWQQVLVHSQAEGVHAGDHVAERLHQLGEGHQHEGDELLAVELVVVKLNLALGTFDYFKEKRFLDLERGGQTD